MKSYPISMFKILSTGQSSRVPLNIGNRGPLMPRYATFYKDSVDKMFCFFESPTSIRVHDRVFSDVVDYSVSSGKGRLYLPRQMHYSIDTLKSEISYYVNGQKFHKMLEKFKKHQNMDVGGGIVAVKSREIMADGTQVYNGITNNFVPKTVTLSPDGQIVPQNSKNILSMFKNWLIK